MILLYNDVVNPLVVRPDANKRLSNDHPFPIDGSEVASGARK